MIWTPRVGGSAVDVPGERDPESGRGRFNLLSAGKSFWGKGFRGA